MLDGVTPTRHVCSYLYTFVLQNNKNYIGGGNFGKFDGINVNNLLGKIYFYNFLLKINNSIFYFILNFIT